MRPTTAFVILCLFGWAASQADSRTVPGARAQSPPTAVSTFESDAEGWTTTADASCRPTPCYAASGGNPDGHIYSGDDLQGIKFYFNAPTKFLGNVSAAYKGHLTFDMRQDARGTIETNDADVILVGAGLRLVYDAERNPPSIWYTYDVPLVETAGWHVGSLAGPAPSAAQMKAVLSSLERLALRGDYIYGGAITYLDNVVLGGSDLPPTSVWEVLLPIIRKS